MLKFDSKTMTRAVFVHPFILSDSNYGIVSVDEDDNIDDEYCTEVEVSQECWIFPTVNCESDDVVFVYIPDMDFATTVASDYVEVVK